MNTPRIFLGPYIEATACELDQVLQAVTKIPSELWQGLLEDDEQPDGAFLTAADFHQEFTIVSLPDGEEWERLTLFLPKGDELISLENTPCAYPIRKVHISGGKEQIQVHGTVREYRVYQELIAAIKQHSYAVEFRYGLVVY